MKPPHGPRILIAEDETLLVQLLGRQLAAAMPSALITAVQSVAELERIDRDRIDLAIVDLALTDGSSLGWVKTWSSEKPGRKAIILTSREEDFVLHGVFNSAVTGFVHKTDGIDLLEMAIRVVLAGGSFFSPKIQAMRSRLGSDPSFFAKILSEREQEILKLVAEGLSSEDIGQHLGLRPSTVTDHRKNIMQKLGVHNQAELMAYAIEKGFSE